MVHLLDYSFYSLLDGLLRSVSMDSCRVDSIPSFWFVGMGIYLIYHSLSQFTSAFTSPHKSVIDYTGQSEFVAAVIDKAGYFLISIVGKTIECHNNITLPLT